MALPVVLLALVVIGALMAGAFFSATQEHHAGRSALDQRRAFQAAERGLAMMLTGWDSLVGDSAWALRRDGVPYTEHDEGTITTTVLRPITPLTYWITAEAVIGRGLPTETSRRVGALIRLEPPVLNVSGAVVLSGTGGVAELGSALRVDGGSHVPSGWSDCLGDAPGAAGLVAGATAPWPSTDTACATDCFAGDPPIQLGPGLDDSAAVAAELDHVWTALAPEVSITLPGGTVVGTPETPLGPREVNGRCDGGIATNWGDPGRSTACARYFPVILADGDLHVAGGAGQGVLLVNGDLTLSGGAIFAGLIIVRGALRTLAPGPDVLGSVRVAGQNGARTSVTGGGRFEYSRCALRQSLAPHSPPHIEPGSWIELHR